jgi:predicted CoA-substrate-specific enzyme activase
MTLVAGIDAGASYTKVVLANGAGAIASRALVPSGFNFARAAERALEAAVAAAGCRREDVAYVAATGYGRHMVPLRDVAVTDLTAHAWAIHGLYPDVRTVLDIGGQNVKAIRLDERGRVKTFRLNDKCAAGSGAFLEKTVRYMGYEPSAIAALAEAAREPALVSSICAVFAESEVINHLVSGRSPEDVCAGALVALAERAAQLVKRLRAEPAYALTGGLTRVPLMQRALEQTLKVSFRVPPDELGVYAGALGAARLAGERLRRVRERASV